MRWLVFATLTSLATGLHARSLEAAYAHRLMRARTSAEADRLRTRFEFAEVAKLACRLQLERGLAPLACYEFIAREREWGLGSATSRRTTRLGLDQRCIRAAAGFKVPAAEGSLRHVSAACATRVRDVRSIEAYRREDDREADGWSGD